MIRPTYRQLSDQELIVACLKNYRKAQRELYDRFSPMMKGVCMRYANSEIEADDILQESFIKVFKHLKNYKDNGKLGAWIRTITINTAIEFYRKRSIQTKHLNHLALEAETHGSVELFATIDLEILQQEIQKLPDGFRVVFNLYAIEGFTHKEIGLQLGISIGTSKSQFSRAKKILQKKVNEIYAVEHLNERHAK
ncbi:MAG: RNA polymerase sigma factor [Crocinitomicaceae bacterium]|nr:RNA polymerase sigma factor [Flavobacteriales bacterium]NQZ37814.1 RNA polymerase sigma factor [Crocinitomicaceae bacterium]